MKTNNEWIDYKLLGTGNGEKLEQIGSMKFLRPDPQVIWAPRFELGETGGLTAVYNRSRTGGGEWNILKPVPEVFYARWRNLKFELKLMNFKHIGIFPEQAVNWDRMDKVISSFGKGVNVLNLFGYTGGATVACVKAGASVCHVDSAKSMCDVARRNCMMNDSDMTKTRFIVDDCIKFVEREIRRGKKYDAVIMDPPSYGRGPKGETWKIEDGIFNLVKLTKEIISDEPCFYLINSYTTGLQPTVMKNITEIVFDDFKGKITDADEIGIEGEDGLTLPCGCSSFTTFA